MITNRYAAFEANPWLYKWYKIPRENRAMLHVGKLKNQNVLIITNFMLKQHALLKQNIHSIIYTLPSYPLQGLRELEPTPAHK